MDHKHFDFFTFSHFYVTLWENVDSTLYSSSTGVKQLLKQFCLIKFPLTCIRGTLTKTTFINALKTKETGPILFVGVRKTPLNRAKTHIK